MTANEITKKDLINEFNQVTPDKENYYDFTPYEKFLKEFLPVLDSEVKSTFFFSQNGISGNILSSRNVVCAVNSLEKLFEGNYYEAWWEMTSILDYKSNDDYVNEDELALIYLVLKSFQFAISNNI